jgi:hypothetical protein
MRTAKRCIVVRDNTEYDDVDVCVVEEAGA